MYAGPVVAERCCFLGVTLTLRISLPPLLLRSLNFEWGILENTLFRVEYYKLHTLSPLFICGSLCKLSSTVRRNFPLIIRDALFCKHGNMLLEASFWYLPVLVTLLLLSRGTITMVTCRIKSLLGLTLSGGESIIIMAGNLIADKLCTGAVGENLHTYPQTGHREH